MVKKKIAFETLGCRLNQHETESLATDFRQRGYHIVNFNDEADVYVINTCTVTQKSDQKSRLAIMQARKRDSLLVVTGCFVESARHELENQEGIDFLVGNKDKAHIVSLVESHFNQEIHATQGNGLFDYASPWPIFHTRGALKIQDGCDNLCSFCIIPTVRGRAQSRPSTDILRTAREMLTRGYKELVITGVNISRWQENESDFAHLVEKILELPGNFRLRLSSLEPENLEGHFLELLDHPRFSPHLHLCLQSGSQRILFLMRRAYTLDDYARLVDKVRHRREDILFSTDMIVGFPGESDEDFNASIYAIERFGFMHTHIFPYSARPGTRSARSEDLISVKTQRQRSRLLRKKAQEEKIRQQNAFLGKTQQVLIEGTNSQSSWGYGQHYLAIELQGTYPHNEFIDVSLHSSQWKEDRLIFNAKA